MRKHTYADRAFQAVTRQHLALNSKPMAQPLHEKIVVGGVA